MDKRTEQAASTENRWGWLPAMMPGVARLMADKRREMGREHLAECWKRGVLQGEPDWFFAREGPLAVGTPFSDDVLRDFGAWPGQALLMVASVERKP